MFLVAFAIIVAVIFGGFYYWAQRQGLIADKQVAEGEQDARRISLLAEAAGYVGAILILAGAAAAIGQRWNGIGDWGRVGVLAGAAVFFLLVGMVARRIREPAIQRLAGVVWFLSVTSLAWAAGVAAHEVYGSTDAATILAVGLIAACYSAVLWLVWRRALQNVALFAGLVITICGIIDTAAGGVESAPSLAFSAALWVFGLAWAWLGWRRYTEPMWVTIPSGVILVLIAPMPSLGDYGWMYAIGIATAAAVMAASIPLRNTPLLALGAVGMFGYVTSAALIYFHETLGAPAALVISGVLIISLAVVSARLMRATHTPKPRQPDAEKPSRVTPPPKPTDPGAQEPPHRDLPKAS